MAYEALAWPSPPASTDNNDGGQAYHMGARFHVLAAANLVGVRWHVPDSVPLPPGGTHYVSVWRVSDEALLATKTFVAVAGGDQDILLDVPVALAAAPDEYVVAVYTVSYTFRGTATPFLVESASLNVRHDRSQLVAWNAGSTVYPGGNFSAWYYVSPLVETAGGRFTAIPAAATPASGTAAKFAAGGRFTVAPAGALTSGSTVVLSRSPNPALLTVTRDRVALTVSRPHVLTTGAL